MRRLRQIEPLQQLGDDPLARLAAHRCRSAISCRFSAPVSRSSTAANWPVTPIAARTALVSVATSCPATRAVPPSAFISVVSTFTVVVLPAPFGPSREKIVPASDIEVDAVEHDLVPVGLPQPGGRDRCVVHADNIRPVG